MCGFCFCHDDVTLNDDRNGNVLIDLSLTLLPCQKCTTHTHTHARACVEVCASKCLGERISVRVSIVYDGER